MLRCNYKPQKALPYTRPRILSYYVLESVHGFRRDAIPRNKKIKIKKKKAQDPYISPPPGAATGDPPKTKLTKVRVPQNVITHEKFEINQSTIGTLARG